MVLGYGKNCWGIPVLVKTGPVAKLLSWQCSAQRSHFVSIVMNISGANFEEHYFNISRDILYSVFYHFSCIKPCDDITFLTCVLQKHQYLKIPKKAFLFILKNLDSNYFSFRYRHFEKSRHMYRG